MRVRVTTQGYVVLDGCAVRAPADTCLSADPRGTLTQAPRRDHHAPVDDADIELRNVTYRTFVELGRAPTIHEIAAVLGTDNGTVRDGWRRLHAGHAIVIDPLTDDLRMAKPFAARPTSFLP